MGTPESKAKYHNVAKDTLYDYHPSLDKDVVSTNKHISDAEDTLGKQMIQIGSSSDPICSSAGCTQYEHPTKKKGYPMNYPVPNFGEDQGVKDAATSIQQAEKQTGIKWKWVDTEPREITAYNTGRPLDSDIQASLKNLGEQESTYGIWDTPTAVQLDAQVESDPIYSSIGLTQYKHPKPAKDPWAPAK